MKWVFANSSKLSNIYLPLTVSIFICLQLLFLLQYGIKIDLESAKYIFLADYFRETGQLYAPSFTLYLTQIFGISLFNEIGLGLAGMVAFQMLISLTATIYFFKTLNKIWGIHTAFVSVMLFLFNLFFQNYTVFLQTESLFFSFITIIFCYIIYPKNWGWNHYITLVLMAIILGFTRPSGILFYPSIIFFLVSISKSGKLQKTLALIAALAIFLVVLNSLLQVGGELNFAIPFQQQMIICGVPEADAGLLMPDNMNSIAGLFSYLINNPINFFSLGIKKTISFFIPFRTYYSLYHNIYLLLIFGLVFFFAIIGIKNWLHKSRLQFITLIIPLTVVWASVVFSCDDWHNRFLLSTYPILIMLASSGINRLVKWMVTRAL